MARGLILLEHSGLEVGSALETHLNSAGYRVRRGSCLMDASAAIDLVIAEDDPGTTYLERTRPDWPPIILLSSVGTMEKAVEAMRRGAADYLVEPVDGVSLLRAVHRALRIDRLEGRYKRIHSLSEEREGFYTGLIGSSQALEDTRQIIRQVATGPTPVLILGETGTGKELAAREIHRASGRTGEFIPINMASLGPNLFEAELFGYEPGSFTGAKGRKQGLLETAENGTLFLDEIGELDLEVQSRLLRLLDDGRFRRVGGLREIEGKARFLAATNRDPEELRPDLYYRLAGMEIRMPPLREHPDDIPPIARHFLAKLCSQIHRKPADLADDAERILKEHSWPGNCRELHHVMERLLLIHPDQERFGEYELDGILSRQTANQNPVPFASKNYHSARAEVLAQFEKTFFANLIEQTKGNISAAARNAEMDRKFLTDKLREHGLHPNQ